MLNIIADLMANHGISQAHLTIKPHGDSIAATITMLPDPQAIPDAGMRVALMSPIVLIGEDAVNDATAESILESVRMSIVGNEYFDSEAVKKRIEAAQPKDAKGEKKSPKKAPAAKKKPEEQTAPASATPGSADELFNSDSL